MLVLKLERKDTMIRIDFVEGANTKTFEKPTEAEMDLQLKHFEKELLKIRTGRAHSSLVEDVRVACYGTTLPIKEVAAISTPESNLIVIQAWDKTIIGDIEHALSESDLGLTPTSDGNFIRIVLPKMSSARRDELVKLLHKKDEEFKIGVRGVRKEVLQIIREAEKSKKISEDYARRLTDTLQKSTDKYCALGDQLTKKKESELLVL